MKRRILLLIILTSLINVSYASFPIDKDNTFDKLTSIVLQDPEGEGDDHSGWEPSPILGILFLLILLASAFFLIREWWRAWRNEVKWVRIFTYVTLGILSLMLLLSVICGTVKGGCVYNMQ